MPACSRKADAWWLMFFYSVTFGGFVGLSSFLPIYFHDQYGLSAVTAGYFTAACVFVGSFARPFGGALADRVGGTRTLSFIYALVAALLLIISRGVLPAEAAARRADRSGMLALGMGNGAVFQLVPQRFGGEIGVMTGLVGMTGGVGGFYLASSLGYAKQFTGSYGRRLPAVRRLWPSAAWSGIAGVRLRWRRDAAALARRAAFKGAGHEHDRRTRGNVSSSSATAWPACARSRNSWPVTRRTAIASPCSAPSRM